MKHLLPVFLVFVSICSATAALQAADLNFEQNQDNGSGEYEWEANNWYDGSTYQTPTSADTCRMGLNGVIDGQTAECLNLEIGGSAGAELTIRSGSLHQVAGGVTNVGRANLAGGGTLNIEGGAVTIASTNGNNGFLVGMNNSPGLITQSGGTLNVPNGAMLSVGREGDASYYLSGGTLNTKRLRGGGKVSSGLIQISGTAEVNVLSHTTAYGVQIESGGMLQVIGSGATISINDKFVMGYLLEEGENSTLAFELDAGGINPITCVDFVVHRSNVTLELTTDGNTPVGTYTLVSSNLAVTQAELDTMIFSAATDVSKWTDLRVVDNRGTTGTYDVYIDYDPNGVPRYALTVNKGTGSGDYPADEVVDISADAPAAGDIFAGWTGDTQYVTDANDPNTAVTMPAVDVTITATYADDPATFHLIVDRGNGDGFYDPDTVVQIVADRARTGKLFDQWTGDTGTIANVLDPNTTLTMPSADIQVNATYVDDPSYVYSGRGYLARPCGFDMDRDGVIGEDDDDNNVGDGVTTDPDGDGINEDIIYVDAYTGSDTTGDGSAGNPYATVQKALDQCDGPGDGAEDIVAIYGTFQESVSIKKDGITGYYERDNFQFPDNPIMLIGWDKDNDGEYPPYDTDDEAVFDGNQGVSNRGMAIRTYQQRTNMEIAHLSIRNYGGENYTECGAIKLFNGGSVIAKHCYVHDVEIKDVNKLILDGSSRIVISWWGGPRQYAAIVNVEVDGYSSYCFRGSPNDPSAYFRFQNMTLRMHGITTSGLNRHTLGWKLWGTHNHVEVIDNVIDAQTDVWQPQHIRNMGLHVCYCAQDYTIRNNEFINCRTAIVFDGDTGGYCGSRPVTNMIVDQNIIRNDYPWSGAMATGISIKGGEPGGIEPDATTQDVTITNNFIWMTEGSESAIYCDVGNDAAPNAGTVTIAGNTIYGPWRRSLDFAAVMALENNTYMQEDWVIKNNIFANSSLNGGDYKNIRFDFAPTNLVMNGNPYHPHTGFQYAGANLDTLAEWQSATGQDANSIAGTPVFVDPANADLHLHLSDTLANAAGVDISDIVDYDIDGDARDANTTTAGADIDSTPPDIEPPTIIAWYSVAEHGRGVGEALLEIPDDNLFSEPRSDGITKLVVEFSEAINPINFTSDSIAMTGLDANNESVDLGEIIIGASLRNGDVEGVITFTPALPDYAKYLVILDGPTDMHGNPLAGDADRILTALVGDVSGDLRANSTDLSRVRAARTKLVDPGNTDEVRADVSCDGRVNAADLSRVRARRGSDATAIDEPGPPPPAYYTPTVNSGSGAGTTWKARRWTFRPTR